MRLAFYSACRAVFVGEGGKIRYCMNHSYIHVCIHADSEIVCTCICARACVDACIWMRVCEDASGNVKGTRIKRFFVVGYA